MAKYDLPPSKTIIPPVNGWKGYTYYSVFVSVNKNNPQHKAIFYSGFLHKGNPGNYACVMEPTYDYNLPLKEVYYMEVIKELDRD